MKAKFFTLLTVLLAIHISSSAQFVREYNPGASSNLIFTCIAKAPDGNYFISGLQDTSIYVSEVDIAGNVIREKLIGIGTNYYRLTSMIVDGDGNIVIAGLWRLSSGGILHAFIMKVSPMLSLISHITYNNTIAADGMAFSDIKDFKTTGANDGYYVTGYTYSGTNGWNALLMRISRSTGAVLATFHGRSAGVAANTVQGNYASLVLDTTNAATPPSIFVSAPLNSGSIATSRPWLVKHNLSTLAVTRAERYLLDIQAPQTASLYDIGLVKDNSSLLYCWYGSPNIASTGTHTAMGITKVDANSLAPVWQKAYTVIPASPSPFKYNVLAKVESDAKGYLARGVWTDGLHEGGGDIFLIRTDKDGVPVWSKQYKNVSNVQSFNSSFIIDGANILAVGYRTNSANNKGILIVTPLATGSMDTTCALPLIASAKDSSFAKVSDMQALPSGIKLQNSYYPINCLATIGVKPCDGCKIKPVSLNSDFTLTGQLVGNFTTFTLTASAYSTLNNSKFIVSQVNTTTLADIGSTILSVPAWGTSTTTGFPSYVFNAGLLYRVRHILSTFNNCGILVNDTTSKLVFLAPGLMPSSHGKVTVVDEKKTGGGSAANEAIFNPATNFVFIKKGVSSRIFPNPANTSVTFDVTGIDAGNMVLKIVNGSGQAVSSNMLGSKKQPSVDTHLWADGLYLYNITSNGKIIAQGKFIVQH